MISAWSLSLQDQRRRTAMTAITPDFPFKKIISHEHLWAVANLPTRVEIVTFIWMKMSWIYITYSHFHSGRNDTDSRWKKSRGQSNTKEFKSTTHKPRWRRLIIMLLRLNVIRLLTSVVTFAHWRAKEKKITAAYFSVMPVVVSVALVHFLSHPAEWVTVFKARIEKNKERQNLHFQYARQKFCNPATDPWWYQFPPLVARMIALHNLVEHYVLHMPDQRWWFLRGITIVLFLFAFSSVNDKKASARLNLRAIE